MYSFVILTHLRRVDSSTTTLWTGLFPTACVKLVFIINICFIEIPVVNANSEDPDQTPRSAASDLGLHCLLIIFFGVYRLEWVKGKFYFHYSCG